MIPAGLLGWAVGFVVVGGAALAPARTRAATGWTLLATAFPGAWLAAWKIGPALGDRLGGEAVAAGIVAAVGYAGAAWAARLVATATEEPPALPPRAVPPAPPADDPAPSADGRAPSTAPPARALEEDAPGRPRPRRPTPPALPTLKPAAGAVAAGAFGGSGDEVERDGLIRVLRLGPDFQTVAAAKGLAVSWADTSDPAVVDAFIDVLRDEGASQEARAEVWIALLKVIGDAPPWDEEQRLRSAGADAIDQARLDALDHALHPGAPPPDP